MTANIAAPKSQHTAETRQPIQARAGGLGFTPRLATAAAVAVAVALLSTGCGRHLHLTFHASQQVSGHVMSKPTGIKAAAQSASKGQSDANCWPDSRNRVH